MICGRRLGTTTVRKSRWSAQMSSCEPSWIMHMSFDRFSSSLVLRSLPQRGKPWAAAAYSWVPLMTTAKHCLNRKPSTWKHPSLLTRHYPTQLDGGLPRVCDALDVLHHLEARPGMELFRPMCCLHLGSGGPVVPPECCRQHSAQVSR